MWTYLDMSCGRAGRAKKMGSTTTLNGYAVHAEGIGLARWWVLLARRLWYLWWGKVCHHRRSRNVEGIPHLLGSSEASP